MGMAIYRTEQDLVDMIRDQIGDRKTQKEWAKKAGISPAYLSDFLQGRRGAGPAILKALGFDPTPFYRKAADDR